MVGPENFVLEYLRRLDTKMDRVIDDLGDLKLRVTNVEEGLAGVNRRLDRLESRFDRVERRLDLTEAPH
jgi:archaellum component FlaC